MPRRSYSLPRKKDIKLPREKDIKLPRKRVSKLLRVTRWNRLHAMRRALRIPT